METGHTANSVDPPVLALDLGQKKVGVAVTDSLSISISRLDALPRSSWKRLLRDVDDLVRRFDAKTLVIGLPLRLNGSQGEAALAVSKIAEKFAISLNIPVYLQDERLTSKEADENLRAEGFKPQDRRRLVDSESAALILRDFLNDAHERFPVTIP
jgi:putative Holliday junction resolvase